MLVQDYAAESLYGMGVGNVGANYEFGVGVEKDIEMAANYYDRAIKLGAVTYKTNLDRIYIKT